MLATKLIPVAALVATALGQSTQSAIVTIEASHGGAGNDLTNTTITVPLNKPYTGSALSEVSYLYLTGSNNVLIDSLTCTPFKYSNGTGTAGLPFNSTSPSLLSTNTVQVGSIVCISGFVPSTPSAGTVNPSSVTASISTSTSSSESSSLSSSSSAASNNLTLASSTSSTASSEPTFFAQTTFPPQTSTFIVTTSPAGGSVVQSTVTSIFVPSASAAPGSATANPAATGSASTTSTAASLNSASSSANSVSLSGEFFGGLALAGFGLAFVL